MALLAAVVVSPFVNIDRVQAKPVQLGAPDQIHLDITRFTNPVPFATTDRPQTFRVPLVPSLQSTPLNLNLYTNPIPFAKFDWLVPTLRSAPLPSHPTRNLQIFSDVPLCRIDMSAQWRVPDFPVPIQPYNLALLNILQQAPFSNYDWSKPFNVRTAPPDPVLLNTNLFTNPIPFAQYDWSRPQGPSDALYPAQTLNINLYGIVAVSVPFNQTDWSAPYRAKSVARDQQPPNSNLFTNPFPVATPDLSSSARPVLSTNTPSPLNLNLYGVIVVSAPFNQMDWPTSTRSKLTTPSQLPTNLSLYSIGPVTITGRLRPTLFMTNLGRMMGP